ncbi:MAG: YjbQ family protein [Thermoplasmata archaeon]|nr:YjbQ family protein [Thermoplasmata archaeon]
MWGILGCNATLPIINGSLTLGTWQSIFFMELFEKRRRRIAVVAMGE